MKWSLLRSSNHTDILLDLQTFTVAFLAIIADWSPCAILYMLLCTATIETPLTIVFREAAFIAPAMSFVALHYGMVAAKWLARRQ